MQPDIMQQLEQLQRQAAQIGQLARDLARASPRRSEGNDATGWARIVLGPNGLPTEIRIRDGWQQRLAPERLGAAVLEANGDAVQRAMQTWAAELDNSRWWNRRSDVDDTPGEETASVAVAPPDQPSGQVRESTELAEEVLAALQATQRQPTISPAPNDGADDGRQVTVQVGPGGLTGCVIDPEWAAGRDGALISAALSSALKRAVAEPVVHHPAGGRRAQVDRREDCRGRQSGAAARAGSIAGNTSLNLLGCAAAGLAFYIVLAGVLVKLITATVAALAAFGSAVFSWAGAAIVLEEAGVNTAIIVTAVSTLAAFLGAQVTAMITLHGDAVDPTSFPNGVWPKSQTNQYSDGTVKDGDADWSLKGS